MGYAINNYSDYINQLAKIKPLDSKLQLVEAKRLIDENDLSSRFGIIMSDVIVDLNTSFSNNSGYDYTTLEKLTGKIPTGIAGKVHKKSYDQLISYWARKKNTITYKHIRDLYITNRLDEYGVSLEDVIADILVYGSWKDQNKNEPSHKAGNDAKGNQDVEHHEHIKKYSSLCDTKYGEILNTISILFKYHSDAMGDRRRIEGILKDYLPNYRKEVNIIIQLTNLGLLEELENCDIVGKPFIERFVSKMSSEYGTERMFTREIIMICCEGFEASKDNKAETSQTK